MLRGKHHGGDPHRLAVPVGYADLRLAVRSEPWQRAVPSHGLQPPRQPVGQRDRQRHEIFCLPAGISKQDALISRAGILRSPVPDTTGDIRGLGVHMHLYRASLPVKAQLRPVISDLSQHLSGDRFIVRLLSGAQFAEDAQAILPDCRFTGHPRFRLLRQHRVQHGVGDLVADFVRMTPCHSFRCQNVFHAFSPVSIRAIVRPLSILRCKSTILIHKKKQTNPAPVYKLHTQTGDMPIRQFPENA